MARRQEPLPLARRPAYLVEPLEGGGWQVRRRGEARASLFTTTRADALRVAEAQAAGHLIAQVVLFRRDGSYDREHALVDAGGAARGRRLLEERLARLGGYAAIDRRLAEDNCLIVEEELVLDGQAVSLRLHLREGSGWDEIHVGGEIRDEPWDPPIATLDDVLWP